MLLVNIIDLGLGNVSSVENWAQKSLLSPKRVSKPSQLNDGLIIIPGVASAGEYMLRLKKTKLDQEIIKRYKYGQKIVGICLGFQIMTNYSEEDSGTECLGLFEGKAVYLDNKRTHNGWEKFKFDVREFENDINFSKRRKKTISGRVYFNHELKVEINDNSIIHVLDNGITSYSFKDNLFGFQFHPEKSQKTGVELLKMLV